MTGARLLAILSLVFTVGLIAGLALSAARVPEAAPEWQQATALSGSRAPVDVVSGKSRTFSTLR